MLQARNSDIILLELSPFSILFLVWSITEKALRSTLNIGLVYNHARDAQELHMFMSLSKMFSSILSIRPFKFTHIK